ncbi:Geranylgeranyl transferase type-1 subunit beta [Lachnellula hyalina]|uniref:Geranylgeranyl transferase type-1 subunit beta n=1 Tax=Lachnellula hyalina TaxID=1316788 RepID=A0A8H8U0I4_9HELO|nr:Geranylgeranyl transferase type-1 subunit beta [Lachnellula hyalina]TVY28947.1 Geranylgeranyl transferase type-1 subunit beta [Lachnellula hyalina]
MEESEPHLDKDKHISYWRRCLLSLLPTQYTSTDSSRMTLGFFILSALDLLSAGPDTFPVSQQAEIRAWILKCQHPHGGFCGSPNHRYPDGLYGDGEDIDPANLPATYFAILSLGFVGGLEGVKRKECLDWLRRLQREDGSFGELVTVDGKVEGGHDMRHCYVASAVRWILRGDVAAGEKVEGDIDVEGLVGHLRNGQTYDGGVSESSSHEAHGENSHPIENRFSNGSTAGYTYCAIASFSFLNRLPSSPSSENKGDLLPGLTNIPATIRWLVSRQVGYRDEEEEDEPKDPHKTEREALAGIHNDTPLVPGLSLEDEELMLGEDKSKLPFVAFYSSRHNTGLEDLENIPEIHQVHYYSSLSIASLTATDIYHSYLGLAALAVMKEPGIKPLDSALCVSKQQRERVTQQRETASIARKIYWKHGYPISIREDNPEFKEKMASSEEPPKSIKDVVGPA